MPSIEQINEEERLLDEEKAKLEELKAKEQEVEQAERAARGEDSQAPDDFFSKLISGRL